MSNREFENFKQTLDNLALINQLKGNHFDQVRAAAITSVLVAAEELDNRCQ